MDLDFLFFFNAVSLGVGLSADAFTVSLANGLSEPNMESSKGVKVAATFGGFQALMPLIGWICVHTILEIFSGFSLVIPWIALGLLGFIGGKMIYEGIKGEDGDSHSGTLTLKLLLAQGIATSIDALSVGFTIAEHTLPEAIISVLIIGAITFGICLAGINIGKKFGNRIAGKATVIGGIILVLIGLEIFISTFF